MITVRPAAARGVADLGWMDSRQGRPLRGLGTARAFPRRAPSCAQTTAQIYLKIANEENVMSATLSTRRALLAASAAAGATSLLLALVDGALAQPSNQGDSQMATKADAIRPFSINFPEEALVDLRRRINATKWPEQEQVTDASQGVQLATIQKLARRWATEYDWRKVEARLNALPQFITEIDGLDIHFIHVRSRHDNALPMIVTH
jgi:Epoxide hydrolase N terminus